MIINEQHEVYHRKVARQVQSLIDEHRDKIGLERRWQIHIVVLCERNLFAARGRIEWVPDTYEATIHIRCNLPGSLLRWEVVHELHELSKYRSGTIIHQFARTVREHGMREVATLFMDQYCMARNQEIEEDVERYLQASRPNEVESYG